MPHDEAQPFLWHWRPRTFAADRPPDEKFWIGVCQWRPYLRGNGLTREVVARVYGFVGDPQAAYDLAAELCRKLNAEGARFDAPPAWLRKQYTVPRSPRVPKIDRPDQPLTGAQVRSLRQRVMRDRLVPAGFVEAPGSTYVRRRGEQLHLIEFQPDRYGGKFTVNLGLHFTFVPPRSGTPKPLLEWRPSGCAFHARIGSFLPERCDVWFDYGNNPDGLRAVLERCADESVGALDRASENWVDPIVAIQTVGRPWHGTYPFVEACIHLHRGRWQAATAVLQAAGDRIDPVVRALLTSVRDRQAGGADPSVDPAARLPDWVLP